jgi:acylglycerol lipase
MTALTDNVMASSPTQHPVSAASARSNILPKRNFNANLRTLFVLLCLGITACSPRIILPDQAVMEAMIDGDLLRMADGAALPLRVWRPAGEPRAILLALHGFNDYSNAFDGPAKFWAERGILTYAYDQRGFGGGPYRGIWPGVRGLTSDFRAAARVLRARHRGLPLFLLGESMGGAVIMAAFEGDGPPPADGYVLSAPAVWARSVMPAWQRAGLWFFAHTVPGMKVTGRGLGKLPSDNIPMLRKLSRDPKVIKRTRIDTVYGLVNLMDAALEAAPKLRGRVLILLGRKEDIIPNGAVAALEAQLPRSECALRLAQYEGGFHMLLRDLNAARVLGDVAAWIADAGAPLPSGAERMLAVAPEQRAENTQQGDGAMAPLALHCAASRQAARP